MADFKLKPLYSADTIADTVRRLGEEITRDYQGEELLLVGILKGSFLFIADLCRRIDVPVTIDFMRLASYGSETQSSGIIEFRKDLEMSIRGKHVLIVEDIIDSGLTLQSLLHHLREREPASLKVCALIDKRARREVQMEADYVGLTMDDGFIIGYGLDYDERYRNLDGIYIAEMD
ncbi:MAG: hypoxanthine phosphoribosyltransferase [Deltaproteobacteria bacterium]|nr:MAG: hypoxanthine phosphoribosyltransferase [Deltaproteobacteria bacterium]